MTNAASGIQAALFASDPNAVPTAFTNLSIVDLGDHLNYQAAYGFRYWDDSQTLTIERQVHGSGGWSDVTSQCVIDHLQAKVTVPLAFNDDDLFRATGKRMALINVADGYDMSPEITSKMSRDVSSFQQAFSEFIPLKVDWKATAKKWFVDPSLANYILSGNKRLVVKFLYIYGGSDERALVGFCRLEGYKWTNPNDDVVTEDWTLIGDSKYGLFWEVKP